MCHIVALIARLKLSLKVLFMYLLFLKKIALSWYHKWSFTHGLCVKRCLMSSIIEWGTMVKIKFLEVMCASGESRSKTSDLVGSPLPLVIWQNIHGLVQVVTQSINPCKPSILAIQIIHFHLKYLEMFKHKLVILEFVVYDNQVRSFSFKTFPTFGFRDQLSQVQMGSII